ncbi:MAG: hypothetical protein ACREMY_02725 [bacterium]
MTRFKAATVVLALALSTIIVAPPAFSMQREGPPGRDNPIVRVIKQLLHRFGVLPTEDIAVPHP